jgi:hypothetical protein
MEKNLPEQAVVAVHDPGYGLPRFPSDMQVRRIQAETEIIRDVGSLRADYLVLDLSLPLLKRLKQRSKIFQLLHEMGYPPVASFKSETPIFGADLFHAVNLEIVFFEKDSESRLIVEHSGNQP